MKKFNFTDLTVDLALQAIVEAGSQEEAEQLVKEVIFEALTGLKSRGVCVHPNVVEVYYGGCFFNFS